MEVDTPEKGVGCRVKLRRDLTHLKSGRKGGWLEGGTPSEQGRFGPEALPLGVNPSAFDRPWRKRGPEDPRDQLRGHSRPTLSSPAVKRPGMAPAKPDGPL